MPVKLPWFAFAAFLLLPALLGVSAPAIAQTTGRIAATGTLMVKLRVKAGCELAIREGVPLRPRCAGKARDAWTPAIVSDDDPEFSGVVLFNARTQEASGRLSPTVSARRYVVDF